MNIFDFFKPKPRRRGKLQPKDEYPSFRPATVVHPEPDEPTPPPAPPQVKKETPAKTYDAEREFLETLGELSQRHSPWEIWKDFVTMFACAISNAVDRRCRVEREAMYMAIISRYNKHDQQLFPKLVTDTVLALEENQEQDFLGHIYMLLELGNKGHGQIFTPYHVCDLMAKLTGGDIAEQVKKEGYISMLGAAGYVKVGNALTEPIVTGDAPDNYWFTPIYFSNVWVLRRIFKKD